MKNKLLLFLGFFLTLNVFAQDNLQIGKKAPIINITDYLQNAPKNPLLKNKFIVLEFWATSCKPCLEVIQHINKIHDQFKENPNLVFLAMTNENPQQTNKIFVKHKFNSWVVCDTTKQTYDNFKITNIPTTVLIDNKGILKFIGKPYQLTDSLVQRFLNNEVLQTNINENLNWNTDVNLCKEFENYALKVKENNSINFDFKIEKANYNVKIKNDYFGTRKGFLFVENTSLKNIFKQLNANSENEFDVKFNAFNYNLLYKNNLDLGNIEHFKIVKSMILDYLSINETTENKIVDYYSLILKDASLLKINLSKSKYSNENRNKNIISFENYSTNQILNYLKNTFKIDFADKTLLKEKLDIIISDENIELVIKSLEKYGLTLEKGSKESISYLYK